MKQSKSFIYVLLCIVCIPAVRLNADDGVPVRWYKTQLGASAAIGAGLSGAIVYFVAQYLNDLKNKHLREQLEVERRVNSAEVQHNLENMRAENERLRSALITLSQQVSGRQQSASSAPRYTSQSQRPRSKEELAERITEEAEEELAKFHYQELKSQNNKSKNGF